MSRAEQLEKVSRFQRVKNYFKKIFTPKKSSTAKSTAVKAYPRRTKCAHRPPTRYPVNNLKVPRKLAHVHSGLDYSIRGSWCVAGPSQTRPRVAPAVNHSPVDVEYDADVQRVLHVRGPQDLSVKGPEVQCDPMEKVILDNTLIISRSPDLVYDAFPISSTSLRDSFSLVYSVEDDHTA
ncbi:hypothetical protein BT63DRAFT_470947 [Microthyrium microscopicum]|uniref:Uncharacterized protein n=1 Tax=Microthyrium microscopicum TaxID=703497 RepID=A0A6A6UEF4_9PEZI|nr:hypothetical protein BT63DRAFT_470947 [Microthyrium microscopicum]